jgi:perosamine synthetase
MISTLNKKDHIIPLSEPLINGNEWKYVKECLDTGWVSSAGKYVDLFEERIAEYTGAKYAVACVNGTSALLVSLRLAGVEPGDEVIVPALSFIAPINAVRYLYAAPVFMDSDNYFNIDSEKTIDFIKKETIYNNGYSINRKTRKTIKAIVPVHVLGNAVWLDELYEICKERNIKIVEDASESLGTKYIEGKFKGKHTGTIGELGCLSFNGNKIITTGGGGMILTDNKELSERARYLTTQAKDDEVRYIHHEVGYNFRLTNIQAALGVAQLEKLKDYLEIKKDNYSYYEKNIKDIKGIELKSVPGYSGNNYWLYAIEINKDIYGMDKDELMYKFEKNRISTRPLWYLNHLQKPFSSFFSYNILKANNLHEKTLCVPSSVNLTKTSIDKVIKVLNQSTVFEK